MKRIKKPIVKDEIVAIEITAEEFAEIAAHECAETMKSVPDDDFQFALMMSIAFADFSARLMHRLFDEPSDECKVEG